MLLYNSLKIQKNSRAPAVAAVEDAPPGVMETPAFAEASILRSGSPAFAAEAAASAEGSAAAAEDGPAGVNVDKCGLMRTFADFSVGIFHNAGKADKSLQIPTKADNAVGFSIMPARGVEDRRSDRETARGVEDRRSDREITKRPGPRLSFDRASCLCFAGASLRLNKAAPPGMRGPGGAVLGRFRFTLVHLKCPTH